MRRILAWGVVLLAVPLVAVADEISGELRPPVRVEAGQGPIDVGGIGYAAPFYGDLDGDGVCDLLVGEFSKGRMRAYKNHGTDAKPVFKEHEQFQAGGEDARVPAG